MNRFVRWLSASALALLATIVLLPQPAAAAPIPCGHDCLGISRDAICWEKEWCAVPIEIKGTLPKEGYALPYRTADGTASAPADYTEVREGVLWLKPGGSLQLEVFVEGDSVRERGETFLIEYLDREGRVVATATVVIRDGV
ncbi:Calx-beta domain-containing protein [Catellatospora bangladeshensis]|uniref:Calx-beta domain-containing protein n=1 Tax=Catellatospora bangladeshensis TaxID=310355 RepID=A0A8J3JDM5_9ACTN|nr:Calx-beta domain-containing protein [Catellatospora bangladeshensis]GIF80714.1 hypothetical protein Cba03nite_20630 [Catellatospora bangladeshensis]